MQKRPGILVFLAVFQIIGLLGDIILGAWFSHVPILTYLAAVTKSLGPWNFWLGRVGTGLAASYAIYAVQGWSLPVCIGVSAYNIVETARSFHGYGDPVNATLIIASYAMNLGLVAYFLAPAVRKVFLDRQLRWWEHSPRYFIKMAGKLIFEGQDRECSISDISVGGTFIEGPELALGDSVVLEFKYENLAFHLKGIVRHTGARRAATSGIQFFDLGPDSSRDLDRLTQALELLRVHRRPERSEGLRDFAAWFVRAVTTGQGWLPESPKTTKPVAAEPAGEPNVIPIRGDDKSDAA